MDRHVTWLRRRVITSVAKQSAATFAVFAIVSFALLSVLTSVGLIGKLLASVALGLFVALLRLALSMRLNPLNYSFMKKSVGDPFAHQVSRFQGVDEAHMVAARLPGFAPVATIRDAEGKAGPVFDVYHDPSRLVAASVSRSGVLSLMSSLAGGRLLVTRAAPLAPHERRVMNVAPEDSVDGIIASHRVALSKQGDVTKLNESAHQVVFDSLALEYASFSQLGPALSSFVDLEESGRSWRVIAKIGADELVELPTTLGASDSAVAAAAVPTMTMEPEEASEVTRITYASTDQPAAEPATHVAHAEAGEAVAVPHVDAPQVANVAIANAAPAPATAPAQAPAISGVPTAAMLAADAPAPVAESSLHLIGDQLSGTGAATAVPTTAVPTTAVPTTAVPAAPAIAPSAFVTAEPDTIDDSAPVEPTTAEVPAVVFAASPVPAPLAAQVTPGAPVADPSATAPAVEEEEQDDAKETAADAGFGALPAALGGSVDKSTLTPRQAPVDSPQLVNRVITSLRGDNSQAAAAPSDTPATLAEAIVPAPDNAVDLTGEPVAPAAIPTEVVVTASNAATAVPAEMSVAVAASPEAAAPAASAPVPVGEHGVPDVLAPDPERPKLSAMIKASGAQALAQPTGKRSRRKKR